MGTEEWRKKSCPLFKKLPHPLNFNSILIFRCYTSSSKRKKDRVKRTQGIRLIDKDWEIIYN
jgi:hypothetical protein